MQALPRPCSFSLYLRSGGFGAVAGLAVRQLVLPGCVQVLEVGHRAVAPACPALGLLKPLAALLSVPALPKLAIW